MEKKREMFAGENGLQGDPRLKAISEAIRVVPHFPKQGIMFQDITTLLLDHKAFKDTVDIFVDRYRDMGISVVAGILSLSHPFLSYFFSLEVFSFLYLIWDRGNFLLIWTDLRFPVLCERIHVWSFDALAIGAKFVPLRKPKKLPGEVISEAYVLEYGTDRLEMHVGAVQPGERALVIDDLIATGGTLCAAIKLLERVGAEVVECACVIGLPEAKKVTKYPSPQKKLAPSSQGIKPSSLGLMSMCFAGTVQVKRKAIVHPCGAPQVDNVVMMAVYDLSVWMVLRGSILAAYELMNLLSIGKSTTILDGICAMQQWGHCTKKGEGM
ncbi:Adenine phosphoribosyltransferase 5 [Vitis vinifera]|uniref:adenine phosphoribosyltransferase n=2 Tax=rosids TaxID=71275 RepID=A0A438HIR9_VITVI|nr:Adenine phosphoribosyltransferase 5 [Vitis vinifera]